MRKSDACRRPTARSSGVLGPAGTAERPHLQAAEAGGRGVPGVGAGARRREDERKLRRLAVGLPLQLLLEALARASRGPPDRRVRATAHRIGLFDVLGVGGHGMRRPAGAMAVGPALGPLSAAEVGARVQNAQAAEIGGAGAKGTAGVVARHCARPSGSAPPATPPRPHFRTHGSKLLGCAHLRQIGRGRHAGRRVEEGFPAGRAGHHGAAELAGHRARRRRRVAV